ncbi:DddA-like double-stranded DNA deaminase toxin [Nocardia sp. NRRL S-836]|uniref:DddA-like double-stranded DNA deaminase toxin n=1 Tax=Nocardia sp. NRRL S-836 TaxID=1519492 RepID=UPI000B2DD2EA|nr:DddA-like double-stranded DNA deaminase toxin [Nocardia sp. NRRL S-836]
MSGFGEVAAGLDNVESKAEQVKAMLHEAEELAGDAAPEKSWAEQQREKLPSYITRDIYVDEDGNTELVQSGQEPDGEHIALGTHLRAQGYPEGRYGRVTASEHVETKVAWRQRNARVAHVEVVVNSVMCRDNIRARRSFPTSCYQGKR